MTDQTPELRPQLQVQEHAVSVAMSESTRVILIAGLAFLAAQFIHNDAVMGAVMAALGVVATWLYGVYRRIRTWSALKYLSTFVDDRIARIGKPKL